MKSRTHDARKWSGYLTADDCKSAVTAWAESMEFGCITEIGGIADGRLDALLFPLGMYCPLWKNSNGLDWTERCGLAGVEIKVSESDFRNGMKEQFSRYDKSLKGLYLAGPAHIVNPSSVPFDFGVLQIKKQHEGTHHAVCRRHPKWKDAQLTISQMWTILWKLNGKFNHEAQQLRQEQADFIKRFGDKAGRILARAIASSLDGKLVAAEKIPGQMELR